MSLINKMLQDLDARGTPGNDAFPANVKPVALAERRAPPLRVVGIGVGAVAACGAIAWFGWAALHGGRPVAHAPASVQPGIKTAAVLKPAPGMSGTITQLPVRVPVRGPAAAATAAAPATFAAPVATAAPVARRAAPADPAPAFATATATAGASTPAPHSLAREGDAPAVPRTGEHARAHDPQPMPETRQARAADTGARAHTEPHSVAPMEPDSAEARDARHAAAIELATRQARLARLTRLAPPASASSGTQSSSRKGAGAAPAEGREESPSQRAENEYRRALASLQDGRMSEALASLQLALRIDPGHDAARQTLVGLLVEANRPDDAIRELQAGLAQDPRQPALAMLLARLQIERGGSGIETLTRSLPYAGNDAEYHAFLAGALQRQGRSREAAEQYGQALRVAPGNGVWWMGLGIALQADKRNAEALDAFRKARAGAGLSVDLQAFVERKIQELGR